MSHFQRLALARAELEKGETAEGAMRKLRPPIHFMRAAPFKVQLSAWDSQRLGDALDLLLETEALCKTTGVPPETVTARALFNIAAMARTGRR
jgi:DNA polymerase-3 subunit delta